MAGEKLHCGTLDLKIDGATMATSTSYMFANRVDGKLVRRDLTQKEVAELLHILLCTMLKFDDFCPWHDSNRPTILPFQKQAR